MTSWFISRSLMALFLALACNAAAAFALDIRSGRLPDTPHTSTNGDLTAQLLFVEDALSLYRAWATSSGVVEVKDIDSFAINSEINMLVTFSGCKPDARGLCNVDMLIVVLDPDGNLAVSVPPLEVRKNKPRPADNALQLSTYWYRTMFEPQDVLGVYTVNVEVRDNNAGTSLRLERTLTAIDRVAK